MSTTSSKPPGASPGAPGPESARITVDHRTHLFPSVANYYKAPVALTSGSGLTLTDADGRQYLDFFGGILTVSVGHCRPEVTTAIADQARTLGHISTLYPHESLVRLARKVSEKTPIEHKDGRPPKVFVTNSGTEADETAVLTARLFTGQDTIIGLRHGYSGRSQLAMTLTAHGPWRHGPPTPGVLHGHNAYCYRCPFGLTYPNCDIRCGKDLEEKIRTETNGRIAALLAEPIQGVGGFITPPQEFFQVVVGIVRKYGGVFICDEVQTGWGRTGHHWCGIEHWGVRPEIMTFAKGIANGFPMAATVARADVADAFSGLTISTFGGNPIANAAALATIGVMEDENTVKNSATAGAHLRAGLETLQKKYPIIGDVRGMGLMQALELVKDPKTKEPAPDLVAQLFEETRQRGLLIGKGGLYGNVIRISPPMIVTKSQVDDALRMFDEAFQAMGPVARGGA